MVAKDIGEGDRGELVAGEVVIDSEVGVGDSENGEGSTIREICGEGHGEGSSNLHF